MLCFYFIYHYIPSRHGFIYHFPDWLLPFPVQLSLKLLGKNGFLGGGQRMEYHEPVMEWQF